MSSHKWLLPPSKLSPKAAYLWVKSASWSEGRSESDSQILIYLLWLFVVSDGKTGQVKIGIEEFKEDIISTCHRPPFSRRIPHLKMVRTSIWETFEYFLRELGWSLYLVWYMYFYWSVPLITMHRWVPIWTLRPLQSVSKSFKYFTYLNVYCEGYF